MEYGILPDTIMKLIDNTLSKIVTDTTIRTKRRNCSDCAVIAIKAVYKTDTIKIFQEGEVHGLFFPLIKSVRTFLYGSKHEKIYSTLSLETRRQVLPPPLSPPLKFNPTPQGH